MSDMSDTESDKDQRSLYSLLEEGDRTIEKLLDYCILFVGKTKAGKSTSMQWLLSQPLMGSKKRDRVIVYKNVQAEGAEIGKGFASSTLVPNIFNIPDPITKKSYSLADMAGFEDSRDYKGIVTVSYMLKAVLEKTKNVKFIITVSAKAL